MSRTSSSSSSAVLQLMVAGSSGGGTAADTTTLPVALLGELGVSMDSLLRLLTAGFADGFQQPVWMVVNLQVIFCRGGVEVCCGCVCDC